VSFKQLKRQRKTTSYGEISYEFPTTQGKTFKRTQKYGKNTKTSDQNLARVELDRGQAEEGMDSSGTCRAGRHATANIARLEGENYDRIWLPTHKKVARALGAKIEIKLSA